MQGAVHPVPRVHRGTQGAALDCKEGRDKHKTLSLGGNHTSSRLSQMNEDPWISSQRTLKSLL